MQKDLAIGRRGGRVNAVVMRFDASFLNEEGW